MVLGRRSVKRRLLILVAVGLTIVAGGAVFTFWNWKALPASPQWALVVAVIDGDTIKLEGGEKVRLIGANTPETRAPGRDIQCFGPEASAKTKRLLDGKRVRLEADKEERDKYGRLLRYVWMEDGVLVNLRLVEEGFAKSSFVAPNVKYKAQFRDAEKKAKKNQRGLWGSCLQNSKRKKS